MKNSLLLILCMTIFIFLKMLKLGEEQVKGIWTEKLVTCKVPVSDPILLNSLSLPGNSNKATTLAKMMEKLKKADETRSE